MHCPCTRLPRVLHPRRLVMVPPSFVLVGDVAQLLFHRDRRESRFRAFDRDEDLRGRREGRGRDGRREGG